MQVAAPVSRRALGSTVVDNIAEILLLPYLILADFRMLARTLNLREMLELHLSYVEARYFYALN